MSLTASIDALRNDAEVWDQVSSATSGAGSAAGTLGLTETSMSFAAGRTGLLDTYNALTDRVAGLLAEGGEIQYRLAGALDRVATDYEASDERAAAKYHGVWDVK
jgi:hypothetical protein